MESLSEQLSDVILREQTDFDLIYGRIDATKDVAEVFLDHRDIEELKDSLATVYKGNIIKNLIMDCQSYTKYRPNETTGGIFVSWRRKEKLPTGA